jgi:protochlorophyllide reductase
MKIYALLSCLAVPINTNAFTLNPYRLVASTSNKQHKTPRCSSPLCSSAQPQEEESNEHTVPNGNNLSRRSAVSKSAQSLAAIYLTNSLLPTNPAFADIQYPFTTPKTIIMTGSNSGIGYDAAKRMATQGHTVILACRSLSKAQDTATKMQLELNDSSSNVQLKLIPKECNLADLSSVRNFVSDLANDKELKNKGIDALCLNAGIARSTGAKDVLRTAQGFELTIGTNHFGHFLLTNEILKNSLLKDGANIVVTASGVHDPDSPGGAQGSKATLGDLQGLEKAVVSASGEFDMVDGAEFDPDKAYKDSKLCNVFFMKELQQRLDKGGKGINVNAYNPGLIVSTGLFRDQNPIFTKLFDFAATDLFKVGENPHWGGGALEYMTLDSGVGSKGGQYYTSPPGSSKYGDQAYGNQFAVSAVSKEAQNDAIGKRFWELSEKLVGV